MILCYHKIDLSQKTIWYVSVDAFFRQMHDLTAYDVVTLDQYDPRNPKHVVITFDGVYSNIAKYALPILREFAYSFELFVIGDWIGRDNSFDQHVEPPCVFASVEELECLCRARGRLQWHTRNHKRFDAMTPTEALSELTVPEGLRKVFPAPHFDWFAFPHAIEHPALAKQVKVRFKGALACEEGDTRDRFRLPRKLVFEEASFRKNKVSVIVANYNYGRYLPQAMESVQGQTIPPDEVLIIDDASTDHSSEVLARYEAPVRVIVNERNLGIVENFRKAVESTSGEYIVFLGADNRMRSDYLEKVLPILNRDERIGIVYTDMLIFDRLSHILAAKVGAERIDDEAYHWRFKDPTAEALRKLKTTNFIHGSSIYRRRFYEAVGGYLKTNGPEDHNLFSRMVDAGARVHHVQAPLIEYRQHSPTQANTTLTLELDLAWSRREVKRLKQSNAALLREIESQSLSRHFLRMLRKFANRHPRTKAIVSKAVRKLPANIHKIFAAD